MVIFGTNDIKLINKHLDEDDFSIVNFGKIIFLADADDDGYHINSLFVNFFYEHFRKLFTNGYIFVGMPPKYIFTSKNKQEYIQDDKSLVDFEYNKIKKDVKLLKSNKNLKQLISIKNTYMKEFNTVKNNLSISEDVLNAFVVKDSKFTDLDQLVKEFKLKFSSKEDKITGIHDGIWHDIDIDLIFDIIENTKYLTTLEDIEFEYKGDKFVSSPNDFFNYIDEEFKLVYNYLKGLGELDADQLLETTLHPDKRNLTQLDVSNEESMKKMLYNFFSSSDSANIARRNIMLEEFSKGEN
jgi:DNA gyrase subunit B